jgi:hypothetical protein
VALDHHQAPGRQAVLVGEFQELRVLVLDAGDLDLLAGGEVGQGSHLAVDDRAGGVALLVDIASCRRSSCSPGAHWRLHAWHSCIHRGWFSIMQQGLDLAATPRPGGDAGKASNEG